MQCLHEPAMCLPSSAGTLLDGTRVGHTELYQIGQKSFEPDRLTQLRHALRFLSEHVTFEEWGVDADGVSEPAKFWGVGGRERT